MTRQRKTRPCPACGGTLERRGRYWAHVYDLATVVEGADDLCAYSERVTDSRPSVSPSNHSPNRPAG